MDAASLVAGLEVEAIVPGAFAEYGELFRGALVRFLGGLSSARIDDIAKRVAGELSGQTAEERLTAFLRTCPTLHKFGQMIARRRDLPDALRALLAGLESSRGGRLSDSTRALLDAELRSARDEFNVQIADAACAEASVALVVPISWRVGTQVARRDGVVKVLKPGVRESLGEELRALFEVSAYLDVEAGRGRIPAIGYAQVFEDVRTLLLNEVDLAGEAEHLKAARAEFGARGVVVPEVLPFGSERVLAMSRIRGVKVTEAEDRGGLRESLARTIVRGLIADVLFTSTDRAIFHGDPHAGNVFATDDGRLALLDWSVTGSLGAEERRAVVEIILGALCFDDVRVRRAVEELGDAAGSAPDLRAISDEAVQRVFRGEFPGLGWMVSLLDRAGASGMRFSPDMMLLRKALFLLDGVLHDLAPRMNADAVLVGAAAAAFVADWGGLAWTTPERRGSRTMLSTADLAELALSGPAAMFNFWTRAMRGSRSGS